MRRAILSALCIFGLAMPAAVPVAFASPSPISEFKSCTKPGQESWTKFGTVACVRGINGKLLWVHTGGSSSSPGEPLLRTCSQAGDRKVFKYWSSSPTSFRQGQYVCVIMGAKSIDYLKHDKPNLCMVTSSSSNYSYSQEKGRCDFAPFKVGQKMWLEVVYFNTTNANILTDEESQSSPAVSYVTKDIPQIPSCFLEQSCGPQMTGDLQKVIAEYPNAIVFPAKVTPLNVPPPSLGQVEDQTNCFGSSWCSDLGIEAGKIVIQGLGAEWNAYGVKNNIPNFTLIVTSPSGKIEQSKYFALPYGYNFITWRVEEIGLWSVQIAGWSGTQRTAWSSAKVVQIKTVQAQQNNSPGTDCASKSGSEITVKYENGIVTFANPFSCAISVVISGQVNCRATWVPIPVSATFSMYSRESRSWGLGGVFPNALSTCVSYMKLAGLNYDGSGGLTMCANKSCLSALTLTGRVS